MYRIIFDRFYMTPKSFILIITKFRDFVSLTLITFEKTSLKQIIYQIQILTSLTKTTVYYDHLQDFSGQDNKNPGVLELNKDEITFLVRRIYKSTNLSVENYKRWFRVPNLEFTHSVVGFYIHRKLLSLYSLPQDYYIISTESMSICYTVVLSFRNFSGSILSQENTFSFTIPTNPKLIYLCT